MPRIKPLEREEMEEPARSVFDRELARFGRLTNMKRTLMHSLPAYHALMQWYPLFDTIKAFLGEQLAVIFAHAISAETDCLICTTFMRRLLIQSKCNPDDLKLDDKGNALVDFGRSVARQGNRVSDALYGRLERYFNSEQLVALTAFAAMMVATNMINNILEVSLDEYLYEYRKGEPSPSRSLA